MTLDWMHVCTYVLCLDDDAVEDTVKYVEAKKKLRGDKPAAPFTLKDQEVQEIVRQMDNDEFKPEDEEEEYVLAAYLRCINQSLQYLLLWPRLKEAAGLV